MRIPAPRALTSRASRTQQFLARSYLLIACSLPAAYAADNPGAHEHGHARLQIALENNRIDLIFTSPAYNLAGFEHEARTDEERNRLTEIKQWLKTTPLANTATASCHVSAATVRLGGDDTEDDHGHAHDHDPENVTHREYEVSQQLTCEDLGGSMELTSALTGEFGNLEELAVEWVSETGQGSARLTSASRAFTIDN